MTLPFYFNFNALVQSKRSSLFGSLVSQLMNRESTDASDALLLLDGAIKKKKKPKH